jgi:hypothetical protein
MAWLNALIIPFGQASNENKGTLFSETGAGAALINGERQSPKEPAILW